MATKNYNNQSVKDFILAHVDNHPADITQLAGTTFGLSRSAINKHMKRLVADGYLEAEGNTKARRYTSKPLVDESFTISLSAGLSEDAIWRFRILPLIKNVKQNVVDICQYCFTEMLNNAIDHSASRDAIISYRQTHSKITLIVIDHGIGIFNKIQKDFELADPREALLELSKGKLTSDSKNHSGQGIFFTSRMLDEFVIRSGLLLYCRGRTTKGNWLIETEETPKYEVGTLVSMEIDVNVTRTPIEVFNAYQGPDFSFRKTHVPIKLSKYTGEMLVSRSQAKRVLARFENFDEVILDFADVEEIGQAFADEIFRVFKNANPDIKVYVINTSQQIDHMIAFAEALNKDMSSVKTPPRQS